MPDPERDATTQTGWHWYHGLTAAQVAQRLAADGDRIVDVEVQSASPYRFAVATVRNEGIYRREWYWYYGLTAAQVAAKLKEKKGRLIDLETHVAGGTRRFAVVMVANTGEAAKNWHWYHGVSAQALDRRLRQHRSRLVDLESYSEAGTTKYAAVMIRNSGVDKTAWWYWRNVPLSKVQSSATSNAARTFSLDRLPNGRYNAVQVKRKSEFSAYETHVDARRVSDFASQNAGRIVDIDAYTKGGQQRFMVIINDNADAFNARVRSLARASQKLRAGRFGFFVKQVGGPISVGLGADRTFEPASALKVLHHLYLHTRLQADPPENLNATVSFPTCPATGGTGQCRDLDTAPYICPTRPSVTATGSMTLDSADREMMATSDYRATFAIEQRYGRATLNAFAASIAATNTKINQTIGCWDPGMDNQSSLVDLGRMIEVASDGSLLAAASANRFFATMVQLGSVPPALAAVVAEEVALAGKPAGIARDLFAAIDYRGAGGGYANSGRTAQATVGRIRIPFKVDGQMRYRAFVFGHFYNCTCSGDGARDDAVEKATIERFRAAIRSAVTTW